MALKSFTALGIDVGGTKIAAGTAIFPEGKILSRRVIPTLPGRGGEAVLADVVRLATELRDESVSGGLPLDGVGLGLCELVSPAGQILSANCIQWQDQPVQERLSGFAPAVLEADVRAAALAEALFGAGRSLRLFLYVTVGTGIASCLVMEGRPYLGARGATGTMASSPLGLTCPNCGTLNRASLEEIAAGPALVRRYNQRHPGEAASGHNVLAAAALGDLDATLVVQTAGEALGSNVGLLINVLDPEAVVIGGGLGLNQGPYWESFVASTRRHVWSEVHRDLPMLRALTGRDAGWLGAAACAWKRAEASSSTAP